MNLKPYNYNSPESYSNIKAIAFSLLILTVCSVTNNASAQQGRSTRQNAIQAFASGNYEKAYTGFSELLVQFPKDPLYKYYAGASLVETGKSPAQAVDLLRQALNAASFKTLPSDALFYLGRAEQMQGNFDEAIRAYNRYTAESGKRAAREKNIPGLIEQSRRGEGKSSKADTEPMVAANQPSQASKKEAIPAEIDRQMGETLEKQYREDSLRRIKNQKPQKPVAVKEQAATTQAVKSQVPEKPAPKPEQAAQSPVRPVVQDTVKLKQLLARESGVFSVFEELPAPVTDPREQISINPDLPSGLVYMIQIGVFRNPQALAAFKGISPIYGFRAEGSTSTNYSAGMFRRMADATKALSAVRAKGFRDSFVVARMDGKIVSKDRSAVLEKEWGNVPLFSGKDPQAAAADTVPPTLVFRVEVARTKQPLTIETVNTYVKFAGDKGLDVRQIEDGSFAYLIGNFITFESAEDYSGLLKRNGYQSAKVTAWLGRKEIDVDTAKQLFENLE